MKIKCLFLAALVLAVGSLSFAQTKTTATTAEAVVKNLYAAKKNDATNPFFQAKNRALIDKYFTKEFGDVIWKTAKSETGWNFDPLTYAQDSEITNFVIGKADENGIVKVKFKNFGKDEEITFFLVKANTASKVWKIESIVYSDAEDLASLLEYSMLTEAEMKEAEKLNKLDGDYMVGGVKCSITSTANGFWARVKCDDQENFQIVDTETLTFGTFNQKEKGRKGKFISPEYGVITKFIDASGKEFKVTRLQPQSKVCGLNLEITEKNAGGLPVQNAIATATNAGTNETFKAALFEAMPVFNDLGEGNYKITVTKAGYKTAVKEITLDCSNLEADDPSVSEKIFLQKGNGK